MSNDLRRYVRFSIVSSPGQPLDPKDVTRLSGITPTETWRAGDLHGTRQRLLTYDAWILRPSSPDGADLTEQADALFLQLQSAGAGFREIARRYGPELQYVVYTGREPTEFQIGGAFVALLAEVNAGLDCDLYYPRSPSFHDGLCDNCGVKQRSSLAEIQDFVGSGKDVAEFQARLRVHDVAPDRVQEVLGPNRSIDETQRQGRHLDISYFESLNVLQYSSHLLPTRGGIPEIDPQVHLGNFLDDFDAVCNWPPFREGAAELVVTLLERGHFQSSTGFHLDRPFVQRVARLGCPLHIQLRSALAPDLEPSGKCVHCEVNVVTDASSDE